MMNVNIGGAKGNQKIPEKIRRRWHVLDIAPNSDIVYDLNSHHPIPLCDGVVCNYYTSHTLEHVRLENVTYVFSELRRTLGEGGYIRIVVPDFEKACNWYVSHNDRIKSSAGPAKHADAPGTRLGHLMAWTYSADRKHSDGHHMVYDTETLSHYLIKAGFRSIAVRKYKSCQPIFNGLDFARYEMFSLYFEARS